MGRQSLESKQLQAQGLKKCLTCEEVLSLTVFKQSKQGWYNSYCLPCCSKLHKEYREKDIETYRASVRAGYHRHKTARRDGVRRAMYGVPAGTYDLLYKEQQGKCAVCASDKACNDGRSFAIDHHHDSGVIRGLLCTSCNQGIGSFRDNPDLLRAALSYIYKAGYTIQELETKINETMPKTAEELGL